MWFYKVICSKIYVLKKVMKRRNYEKDNKNIVSMSSNIWFNCL